MTKDQFLKLGLTEEQAVKAAEESTKELKTYVPIHRFEEVDSENKTLKTTTKEHEKALEDLKKNAGAGEELQKQIEKLQKDSKEAEKKYQEELKEVRLNNAIKMAISGKVHNEEIAIGLFAKDKLIPDGEKVLGLEEQLKTLKESHAFLFKEEKPDQQQKFGFTKIGGEPQTGVPSNTSFSLKDAVAGYYQQNK